MDSFYILVMDKNNTAANPTWFITEWDAHYERLKALISHGDQICRELPKAYYPGTEFCKVLLTNTHSGKEEWGAFMRYKKLTDVTAVVSVLVILVSGCGSTPVVGRYKECTDQRGNACKKMIPDVDISVVFSPVPKPVAKTGADLTERAQAAYMTALSEKSKTADDLRKNFDSRIGNAVESTIRSVTSFDGTLIITVSEVGPFNPADRLERTEVEIKLDQVRIPFHGAPCKPRIAQSMLAQFNRPFRKGRSWG